MAPSAPFFTSLQGLRFVAAMMVVYQHTAGRVNLIHTGDRDIVPAFGGAALHYVLDAPLQAGRKRLQRMAGRGQPVTATAVGEV